MNAIVKNNQFEFEKLPITEQLLFILDSETELNRPKLLKDKGSNAIIGALLADLFLMRKIGLFNNKVVVTATTESEIDYIDGFISKLRSTRERMSMKDIIYEEKPLAEGIGQNIRDKLLTEEWLTKKKGIIPFLSQKELQPESKDLLKEVKRKMRFILTEKEEPTKKEIYFLAILQAMNLLKPAIGSFKDEQKVNIRLNKFLTDVYLAKMIHDAIKSQTKPESQLLANTSPPGYIAGIGGLVSR